jgi:ABC-type multidrug transport system ATPase subunit
LDIALSGITRRFGSTVALDDVSLEFRGRVNLVLGTNGSGKSTLINIIAGVTYPQKGSLAFGTKELRSSDRRAWRRGIEGARAKMGFILDKPGYPTYVDGVELLEWASSKKDSDWTSSSGWVPPLECLVPLHGPPFSFNEAVPGEDVVATMRA